MRISTSEVAVLALVASALTATAQIAISHTDMAGPGFAFTSHQVLWGVEFDVGSAGANGEWAFGDYEWEASVLTHVVSPESTPFAESFPTATRAIGTIDDNSFSFEEVNQDVCLMLGTASESFVQLFDDPVLVMSLPVTYQSTWTSILSTSQELEPGMVMMMIDSGTVLVDGWGVVSTPFGEFDVLRFFTHHFTATYLNGELITELQFLSYAWVNQDGIAVVNVDSDFDVVDPNFDFGTIEMNEFAYPVSPGPTFMPKAFVVGPNYPNPFNATTMLPVDVTRTGSVTLAVYDETGRLVSTRTMVLPAGRHDLAIDGDRWATGNYFARVTGAGQSEARRMLLLK
ncbi:MAG: T9SS type A sorting domain-containing protein [bacterium]|nr:T9SS type A sorting domain-containing protein [bacterium]